MRCRDYENRGLNLDDDLGRMKLLECDFRHWRELLERYFVIDSGAAGHRLFPAVRLAMATVPPGTLTRVSSLATRCGRGANMAPIRLTTTSELPSGKGRDSA
jgi:hypothetical protein